MMRTMGWERCGWETKGQEGRNEGMDEARR